MATVQKVCATCGGTDVRVDAYSAWNVETQEWELAETFDDEFCMDCEGETTIRDEPIS